jgi:hypothetical protein
LRDREFPKLNQAIVDLNLNVAPAATIISEYPGKFFNRADGQPAKGCGVFDTLIFWGVEKRDAVAMNAMADALNAELKLLAEKHKWRLVTGLSSQFARHGYCATRSFYRSASHSCDRQGDFEGTMHPNAEGTGVVAKALERELRIILPDPPGPPKTKK